MQLTQEHQETSAPMVLSFHRLQVLLLLLTGACACMFFLEAARFLPVRGDNLYPEAAGVLTAQRWAHGFPLYEDYRQPPYLITPYPPAWYALLAGAAKLGVSGLDSLTLFGRVLTLVCLFGLLALGYSWNRRLGLSRSLSILTPAFYLSLPILIPWAVSARPDFPAILFAFTGLYLIGKRQSAAVAAFAGALCATAFLMRHNAVAVPVAVVLWLLFARKVKHAALFCVSWAVVVIATFFAFQSYSKGLLGLSLSGATFGTLSVSYIRDLVGRLISTAGHGFAIVLFALAAYGLFETIRHNDRQLRLLNVYCVVSLGFALLGTAARGAAVNHFLEPAFAMAMLVPSALAHLEQSWNSESSSPTLISILLIAILLPSLDMQRSYAVHNSGENLAQLMPLISTKAAFTDIPYLSARSSALTLVEPVSLMNTENAGGRAAWSSARLATDLRQKKYDVVVLSSPADVPFNPQALYPRYAHLSPTVQEAVARNYGLCFKIETGSIEGASETRYVYAPISSESQYQSSSCRELKSLAGLRTDSDPIAAPVSSDTASRF